MSETAEKGFAYEVLKARWRDGHPLTSAIDFELVIVGMAIVEELRGIREELKKPIPTDGFEAFGAGLAKQMDKDLEADK